MSLILEHPPKDLPLGMRVRYACKHCPHIFGDPERSKHWLDFRDAVCIHLLASHGIHFSDATGRLNDHLMPVWS